MKLSKEKRYKAIIKISNKLVEANFFKSYFQEKAKHYENKLKNQSSKEKSEIYSKFCEINSSYWQEVEHNPNAGTILVEGFFGESGPNYVIRVGTITKALEEVTKAKPLVLLRCGVNTEPYKKQIWSSFKFDNFIGISEDIEKHLSKIKVKFFAWKYFLFSKFLIATKQYERFIKLSYKGLQFGDMLYDEITKIDLKKTHTIKSIDKKDFRFFRTLFEGFFYCEYLWESYDIKYFVTTHSQYVAYGLPARFLRSKGVPVIETTDDILFLHDEKNDTSSPKFHPYIQKTIKQNFDKILNNEELINDAKRELNARFDGSAEQIDVKMAYADKKEYSEKDLREKLGIQNNYPIVYVFAHIFADAPCGLGDFQLFPDYFQWLEETVKFCSQNPYVNWVIKEHPSVDAYGERGEVKKIVNKYKKNDSTIFMCPEDFSTVSVKETAKALITAQGTVALEFACVGLPAIITSAPFYKGFGFTIEPKTKKEYFEQLKNIQNIEPLSEDQKRKALAVFKGFKIINNIDFSLIDSKVKDLTWGCGVPQDILGAFEIVSDRLLMVNPRHTPLYDTIVKRYK